MRARQGSGSTSPSEGGSPQVYRNVFSELSNLIRSRHSTLLTVLLKPVVAHWQEGCDNGNSETSIEVPPPLDTDSPWYRGKDLHPHCFKLRFLAACVCVSAVCRHVTHSSSAFAGLSPYKERKLELQHRHTILVVRNQEIMIDLWKKTVHRFPAAHVLLWPLNKVACILSVALQAAKFPADVLSLRKHWAQVGTTRWR